MALASVVLRQIMLPNLFEEVIEFANLNSMLLYINSVVFNF